MSYGSSKTSDVLWGARKEVLSVMDVVEFMLDVKDPVGCLRNGVDRDGEPLDTDPDTFTLVEMLDRMSWKLSRANAAMREVEFRLSDMERRNAVMEARLRELGVTVDAEE